MSTEPNPEGCTCPPEHMPSEDCPIHTRTYTYANLLTRDDIETLYLAWGCLHPNNDVWAPLRAILVRVGRMGALPSIDVIADPDMPPGEAELSDGTNRVRVVNVKSDPKQEEIAIRVETLKPTGKTLMVPEELRWDPNNPDSGIGKRAVFIHARPYVPSEAEIEALTKRTTCPTCKGSGAIRSVHPPPNHEFPCTTCSGTGKV